MKLLKRLTSIILTVAMIATLTVVPAGAADPFTVAVSSVTADAGASEVNLDISVANNPGFTAMSVRVYYKADVLTCTKINVKKDSAGIPTAWNDFTEDEDGMFTGNPNDTESCSTERTANGWKLASLGYVSTSAFGANGNIARLVFTIVGDAESCKSAIEVEVASCTAADGKTDVDLSTIKTVNGAITVNGVVPTINGVMLSSADVTVNGTEGATVKAQALSAKGTDITNGVAWSVSGGNGVSITDDGTITVDAKAEDGSYTVTASAKDSGSQGEAQTATLTVEREPAKAATITLERHWTDVVIPYDGQAQSGFGVTVKDQYGDEMKNAKVKWSITPEVAGVSIKEKTNEVFVVTKAKDTIATSMEFTVTATCGNAKAATETFTVKRAKAEVKTITISGAEAVTIPTGDTAAAETYTAAVKDQYDSPMADQNVVWSVSQAAGVSMANGKLTVDRTAQAGNVTITAKVKDTEVMASKTVKLQSVEVIQTTAPTVKETPIYGDTWSTIVTSIGSYSAKVGDNEISGTYSLKDADARPDAGKQTYTILFNSTDGTYKNIVVATGEVEVQPYTLTVTKGNIAVSKTYDGTTAVTADNVNGKLDYTNPSFGDELSITYTSAVYNDANVASADKVTFSGLKLEGTKAANYKLNVDSFDVDAEITKAPLTIKANDSTITYGNTPQDNGFTVVSGLCGNDKANVVTGVTYSFNYTQGGNVGPYTITPAGGEAANYEVKTYENGTLTVSPKALFTDAIAAIDAVTYNGTAQTPALTVKDGEKVLTAGTDYTAVYSDNTNAGTATVVVTGKGNYSGTAAQTFTINKKQVTVTSGITAVDREYNSTTAVELDCTKAVFDGLIAGDNLTVTATGTMADAHAGNDKEVTISGLTLSGTSAGNYVLAETGNQSKTTVNISKQAATALTLTAKDAVYTAAAYDAKNVTPSRNANDVHLTYYADNNGQRGAEINAPVNAGTYWVSGKINETEDISAAVASAVKFQITKAQLTITARDKTITYGAEPEDGGYIVIGLLGDDESDVFSAVTCVYSYTKYDNVGTYTITPKDATADNYDITFESGKLTVVAKTVTVSGITAKDRQYNGEVTVELDCTEAVFDGIVNNDVLTVTATGTVETADAAQNKEVTISGLTLGGASAGNYVLAGTGHQTTTTVNISKKTATELALTAKNAAYTGVAYNAAINVVPSRDGNDVVLTYYADNDGQQGNVLNAAPVTVGTYWVSGKIEESNNIAEAVASAVKFQITKAPLTITARDKTITYGAEPDNGGYIVTGLLEDDESDVFSSVTHVYNYTQYGNVGTYTITPKDATAANYDITFVPGKLTVERKEVGLTWNNAGTLYYDGKAKNVTAAADGLVNGDEVTVTVAGGKQIAIGSYSAAATGLTGAKAGNYKLPADNTKTYKIEAALTSVTVDPATIAATIDNSSLTIKLTGYRSENEVVTVTGNDSETAADGKLTVHEVEYTIDDSAVVVKPAGVTVNPSVTEKEKADGADDTITDEVLNAINVADTKGEGLEKAAASLIESISEGKPEGTSSIEVTFVLKIQPKTYKDGKLTLVIEPYVKRVFKDANGAVIGEEQETKISNSELKSFITVSIKLPNGFNPNFAMHHNEMIPVTVEDGVATWQQSSFSEVTLVSDPREATITFKKADGSTITKTYTAANLGEALPTDSKAGHTFNGWTVGDKTYKTLTDEALTDMAALAGDAKTLTASFTQNGGGSIGGGGAATYPVSVDKAENGSVTVSPKSAAKGGTVTIEVKPDEGYELASVTVLDKDGKKIEVTVKDGKYSFVMPDGKVTVKAEFAKKSAMNFADVAANSWYYDAVKYCFDNGLMNGVGEDKFAPSATTTRAMIWTVLARDAGVDTSTGATWYEAGMKWAMENKISDGTGAENAITREQFATMLYRVAQSKGEGFTGSWYFLLSFDDAASISDWADEAMHWCVMKGILNGSNNKLNPTDNASRAEVAAMLMRFLTLDK